jgi:hypothetical protein
LIAELEKQFLAQELLNATRVIYPQYWFTPKVETIFLGHMALLQAHYEHLKSLGTYWMFVGPLLNLQILDQQSSFFKLTMQNHYQVAMQPSHDCNLTSRLWERLGTSTTTMHGFFYWVFLVKNT